MKNEKMKRLMERKERGNIRGKLTLKEMQNGIY
jgi:hypothetical protein